MKAGHRSADKDSFTKLCTRKEYSSTFSKHSNYLSSKLSEASKKVQLSIKIERKPLAFYVPSHKKEHLYENSLSLEFEEENSPEVITK